MVTARDAQKAYAERILWRILRIFDTLSALLTGQRSYSKWRPDHAVEI